MSKLSQLSQRPATVILTSRADLRYLATLANFWNSQGEAPRSISELVRLSLESFAEFLISAQRTSFVQTHGDAQEIMSRLGLTIKKTNPKNFGEALAGEDSIFDSILSTPKVDHSHQIRTKQTPITGESPELAIAKAKLEQMMDSDLKDRVEASKKNTEDFKKSLLP